MNLLKWLSLARHGTSITDDMSIIGLIVLLIVVGVALYLIGLIPMDAKVLMAIRAIVILLLVLWLLSLFFDFGTVNLGGHVGPLPKCR